MRLSRHSTGALLVLVVPHQEQKYSGMSVTVPGIMDKWHKCAVDGGAFTFIPIQRVEPSCATVAFASIASHSTYRTVSSTNNSRHVMESGCSSRSTSIKTDLDNTSWIW